MGYTNKRIESSNRGERNNNYPLVGAVYEFSEREISRGGSAMYGPLYVFDNMVAFRWKGGDILLILGSFPDKIHGHIIPHDVHIDDVPEYLDLLSV